VTPVAGTVSYANGTATFTPADSLAPLSTYTVTINTGAQDLAGNALSSDLSWSFTTGVAPDTTAPIVDTTRPGSAETGIPLNQTITANFTEAMDASTINMTTFTLRQGTTVVAGTVTYSNGTASFAPADNLAPLTTYTATISAGARDLAGNGLTTDTSWSFTTGAAPDTTSPVLGATGPSNASTNVPINQAITATFSEAMDGSTINPTTFTVMQGTTPVAGTVSYANGTATFTPAENLSALTTYTATISTGATDLAGNGLTTAVSWSFTIGEGVLSVLLQSATEVAGPYSEAVGLSVDPVTKTIRVPQSGNRQFYRIRAPQTITGITISGNDVVLTFE